MTDPTPSPPTDRLAEHPPPGADVAGAGPTGRQEVLEGRYVLGDRLGAGGMAEVRRAFDLRLRRQVAVKLLRAGGQAEPERFLAEIRVLARLEHPGIVRLLDAGTTAEGRAFLVMELVEGPTLAAASRAGAMSAGEVARVAAAVAGGLAYVHDRGIVHRDVKPANILLGPDDRVRLADFGIARLVDTGGLTVEGLVLGTPAYLAPEQVRGGPVGPPADVYALGLVLAECLLGTRVFDGPPAESAAARLRPGPLDLSGVPASWRPLLATMTDPDPARRPLAADVAARASRLGAADDAGRADTVPLAGLDDTLAEPSPVPPPEAPGRRHRGVAVAAALALLVAGSVLAASLGSGGGGPGRRAALRSGRTPTRSTAGARRTTTTPAASTSTTTSTSTPAASSTTAPVPRATGPDSALAAATGVLHARPGTAQAAVAAFLGALRAGLADGTVTGAAAERLVAGLELVGTSSAEGPAALHGAVQALASTLDGLVKAGAVRGPSTGALTQAVAALGAATTPGGPASAPGPGARGGPGAPPAPGGPGAGGPGRRGGPPFGRARGHGGGPLLR